MLCLVYRASVHVVVRKPCTHKHRILHFKYIPGKFYLFYMLSHFFHRHLTYCLLETRKGSWAKSADQDQTPHCVASDQGLHCFLTGFPSKV